MPKKFFDIFPVEKKEEKVKIIEKKEVSKKNYSIYYLIVFFILILGSFSWYSLSASFEIEIIPEIDVLEIQDSIFLDKEIEQTIYSDRVLAVKDLEIIKTSSQEFMSSGKVIQEEKASGVIRVYNEHSTEAQPLLPETRFVSADGKIFRSVQREVIPGGTYEGRTLVPGYLDIEVIADKPGPDYNIKATTFSIPGFIGTAKYTTFYGKSSEPMQGGIRKEVNQIIQEDLNQAEEILIEKLKEEIKKELLTKVPVNFLLIEPSIEYEILEVFSSNQAGEINDYFKYQAKIKATGLVFKEAEIEELLKRIAGDELEGREIKPNSLEINYQIIAENELIALFSLKTYQEIDLLSLKKEITLKSKEQTKSFLREKSNISDVVFVSWPLLRRRIPERLDMIEIDITLD